MHKYIGIWIDHAHASVIRANKLAEMDFTDFNSDVEPHHKGTREGGEHVTIVNQHRDDNSRHNEMKAFSREIIKTIQDADEIVIFGPGTAKNEFKNILEENKGLFQKLKSLETTDNLTAAEMTEFMKNYFHLPQD